MRCFCPLVQTLNGSLTPRTIYVITSAMLECCCDGCCCVDENDIRELPGRSRHRNTPMTACRTQRRSPPSPRKATVSFAVQSIPMRAMCTLPCIDILRSGVLLRLTSSHTRATIQTVGAVTQNTEQVHNSELFTLKRRQRLCARCNMCVVAMSHSLLTFHREKPIKFVSTAIHRCSSSFTQKSELGTFSRA